jgi:hypothetical protein
LVLHPAKDRRKRGADGEGRVMASVHLQRGKPTWYGAFTDAYGARKFRSTGTTDKAKAQLICEEWEAMAQRGEEPPRIRKDKDFTMKIGRAKMGAVGASFPKDFTKAEWKTGILEVARLFSSDARMFRIGDVAVFLERKIKESSHSTTKAAWRRQKNKFFKELPISTADVAKCFKVAHRIPPELRRDRLTWHHHFIISKLNEERLISEWLEKADKERLSPEQLKSLVSAQISLLKKKSPLA